MYLHVARGPSGLLPRPGYKYEPSAIVTKTSYNTTNRPRATFRVPLVESTSSYEGNHRSVDLRKYRQPCYHV